MSTSAHEKAGQSGRKSVKSWSSYFLSATRGRNWYCSTSSRRYTDFARRTITRDIFNPGPTRNKQAKTHTFFNFAERISFAEHGKMVAESSEFHLTLTRAHTIAFFPTGNTKKKAGHFMWKAGKRDGAKKSVSLRPKAVVLTPMR